MTKPNIKDVAKLANVSTATVSNVITGKKTVSDELQVKVHDAIEKLDYEPNITARSLKTNKTFRIAVIVPDIANPFFSDVIKHIEKEISKTDYQLVLFDSHYSEETEISILEYLLHGSVDGIMLVAPRIKDEIILRSQNTPICVLDRTVDSDNGVVTSICVDNYQGGTFAADYFIANGYEYFVCITGKKNVPNANLRLDGFKDALFKKGISSEHIEEYRIEFTFEESFKLTSILLDNYDLRYKTGFFVCSDIAAWGAMEAAKTKGLKIPKDVGFVGFDDVYFAKFIYPGLTTIMNPTEKLSELAVEKILDQMKCKDNNGETIIFDSELIVRNSA